MALAEDKPITKDGMRPKFRIVLIAIVSFVLALYIASNLPNNLVCTMQRCILYDVIVYLLFAGVVIICLIYPIITVFSDRIEYISYTRLITRRMPIMETISYGDVESFKIWSMSGRGATGYFVDFKLKNQKRKFSVGINMDKNNLVIGMNIHQFEDYLRQRVENDLTKWRS